MTFQMIEKLTTEMNDNRIYFGSYLKKCLKLKKKSTTIIFPGEDESSLANKSHSIIEKWKVNG